MTLHEHVPLRDKVKLGTGGAADFYCETGSHQEVIEAIAAAQRRDIPWQVIGQGSAVLVSDSGFPGLIIHHKADTLFFMHDRSQVIVDAGMPLKQLITQTISQGYSGLEFLTGLAGTIGGAVYTNRSAFGYEISQYVKSVTLLFSEKGAKIHRVERDWFEFSPNSSRLKQLRRQGKTPPPVIISVTLQLSKMDHASCLQRIGHFHSLQREYPYPDSRALRVFDNLTIKPKSAQAGVTTRDADKPRYIIESTTRSFAKVGDIAVFGPNPNFIVNTDVGTSQDGAEVIHALQTYVHDRYTATPLCLVEQLGYWD